MLAGLKIKKTGENKADDKTVTKLKDEIKDLIESDRPDPVVGTKKRRWEKEGADKEENRVSFRKEKIERKEELIYGNKKEEILLDGLEDDEEEERKRKQP
jgi:hypothetical protein